MVFRRRGLELRRCHLQLGLDLRLHVLVVLVCNSLPFFGVLGWFARCLYYFGRGYGGRVWRGDGAASTAAAAAAERAWWVWVSGLWVRDG